MKRLIPITLALALGLSLLSGCGNPASENTVVRPPGPPPPPPAPRPPPPPPFFFQLQTSHELTR